MWAMFFITVLVTAVFLIAPGYLVFRAFDIPRCMSVALAPAISVALVFVIGNFWSSIGVQCSWCSVGLPAIILPALLFLARDKFGDYEPAFGDVGVLASNRALPMMGLYVVVGVLVGIYVLVLPFGDPTYFVQEIDNKTHLATIRDFVETGCWSSFLPSFYPRGWHSVAALSGSLLNTDYALVQNATNFAFSSIVFPTAMLAFLDRVLGGSKEALVFGAFITPAFAAFPWGIIHWGPLFPNMAAFCVFPLMAVLFIHLIDSFGAKCDRVFTAFAFVVATISCACLHPNSVFLAIVLLTPYCVQRIFHIGGEDGNKKRNVALAVVFVAVVAVAWYACFKLPFMQGAVNQRWDAYNWIRDSLFDLLIFRMTYRGAQIALGILIVVGIIRSLMKSQYRWLPFSYALMCTIFVVDTAKEGFIKHLLAGFWYSDPCRISACVALLAIPLAVIGISAIADLTRWVVTKFNGKSMQLKGVTVILVVLFVLTNYAPQRALEGYRDSDFFAFDKLRWNLQADTHGDEVVYSDDERAFVRECRSLIGDSLVINSVDDGSLFAYGADGLNTYFRTPSSAVVELPDRGDGETYESWIIRSSLCDIASNDDVEEAVKSIGADYVLQLDSGGSIDEQHKMLGYSEAKWSGIDAIDDSTLGFKVVLSDGDMRLYRIAL